jgi:hypothetical protein
LTLAGERCIELTAALRPLFPDGGLRRGSTVAVTSVTPGSGAVTLALALLVEATQQGGWCAVVGMPSLGLVAAGQLGVRLDRLAVVAHPGAQWAVVVAALLDSLEVVVVAPPGRVRPADARRLAARARERGAVLVVRGGRWPEAVDVGLRVEAAAWSGLADGHGYLQARQAEVVSAGRGAAARERRVRLWLPSGDGVVVEGPPLAPALAPVVAAGPVVASLVG